MISLIKRGVTDIFGYPGGYIVPFMDALYKHKDEIKTHICYNESGCAFAANGYARVTGKVGVYFTTSGPGAVNALGGLADAWFDGIPLIGICGNVPTLEMKGKSGIRQNGFQEMDLVSITKNITKLSVTPINAEELPDVVERAFNTVMIGRKGGAIIDFPYNIQRTDLVIG